jgi:hypothetical protein
VVVSQRGSRKRVDLRCGWVGELARKLRDSSDEDEAQACTYPGSNQIESQPGRAGIAIVMSSTLTPFYERRRQARELLLRYQGRKIAASAGCSIKAKIFNVQAQTLDLTAPVRWYPLLLSRSG